jgi:dTDP-4-dehydrorhamnose 3,5-epimerase
MIYTATSIPDVLLIEPQVFGDERGFNMETFRADELAKAFRKYSSAAVAGIVAQFVQDNHSGSRGGILRGLHYQIRQAQGKLVRVVAGEIFDVAVDLRKSSPTFSHWVGLNLSAQNKNEVWMPPGFAHGFYVLSDWAEVIYKVTDYYAPQWERTLLWNDPDLAIAWPLRNGEPPILSPKDIRGTPLRQAELFE